jgi:hypothetical protein
VGAYWLQSAWSQLRIIDRSREILICRVWFRDSVVGGMPVAARADDERPLYLFGPRPTVWGLVADPHLGGRVDGEVPRIGRAARISPCGFSTRSACYVRCETGDLLLTVKGKARQAGEKQRRSRDVADRFVDEIEDEG